MADDNDEGIRKTRGLIAGAQNRIKMKERDRRSTYPKPGRPWQGVQPGEWQVHGEQDATGYLPADCPVKPLGYDGENFYFLDTMGQVFNTGDSALGVERIQKLFAGHEDFVYWAWPAKEPKKMFADPTFKSERIRRDLYAACRERGAWSSSSLVRGRGAWRDLEGNLILHCGDHLWLDGKIEETGEHGDFIYPRRPPSLAPWSEPVLPADNPAIHIVELLRTWNFARGDIDAMFLLGWIGVAMLGGALEWRPSIFSVGDAGTGKSELFGKHGLLRAILGRMMVTTTNASEAGLYQLVGHDSLPISIDELEGDEGREQAQKIIKMARDAASGSVRIRGGQNHKGVDFEAQSTFSFSGINPPPIPPANLTRLVIVEMLPLLATSNKKPVLKAAETVGPRLLRVLMDKWEDLKERLEEYYAILREAGHDSRGQKTFGTFLAVAHTMLGQEGLEALGLPHESSEGGYGVWGERLAPDKMPELEGVEPEWKKCLDMILTSIIDNYSGGQRRTVAQELQKLKMDPDVSISGTRERLAAIDIGLMGSIDTGLILVIPNQSQILGTALINTPYGDRAGNGSWKWALRRGPPEIVMKEIMLAGGEMGNRVTVAGVQRRCLFVNLKDYKEWLTK
jgi:hypothetical protein